jgi:hypothetical protein
VYLNMPQVRLSYNKTLSCGCVICQLLCWVARSCVNGQVDVHLNLPQVRAVTKACCLVVVLCTIYFTIGHAPMGWMCTSTCHRYVLLSCHVFTVYNYQTCRCHVCQIMVWLLCYVARALVCCGDYGIDASGVPQSSTAANVRMR